MSMRNLIRSAVISVIVKLFALFIRSLFSFISLLCIYVLLVIFCDKYVLAYSGKVNTCFKLSLSFTYN